MTTLESLKNGGGGSSSTAAKPRASRAKKPSPASNLVPGVAKIQRNFASSFLSGAGAGLFGSPQSADPLAEIKERMRLVEQIRGYHEKFADKLGPLDNKQYQAFNAESNVDVLREHILMLQRKLAAPFAEGMLRELFLDSLAAGEVFFHKYLPILDPKLDINFTGTSMWLREHPDEIESELKELSILWQEWLCNGPGTRLILKTIKTAYTMHIVNTSYGGPKGGSPAAQVVNDEQRDKYKNL